MPPPRVSPPTPVVETMPPVVARPCRAVVSLKPPQVAPPAALPSRWSGSTVTDRMPAKSGNHRAVGGAEAGHAVPAAADRQLGAGLTGVPHHRSDVLGRSAADHRLRPCVDHSVVDPAGFVVAAVHSGDDRTAHPPLQGFQCPRRHDASSVLGRLRLQIGTPRQLRR